MRFVDSGTIQRQTSTKEVFIAQHDEWREDCLPLAIPCSLWAEPKYFTGPDLKFFFNDTVSVRENVNEEYSFLYIVFKCAYAHVNFAILFLFSVFAMGPIVSSGALFLDL